MPSLRRAGKIRQVCRFERHTVQRDRHLMLPPSIGGLASPLKPRECSRQINLSMCLSLMWVLRCRQWCTCLPTAASTGTKANHPFIKLQCFNGSGSLETFLMKFQRMAAYLCWDDEDTFNHLCASLDGAAELVLWDLLPHASTVDLVCLLQTRFGTQLQAKHFKAELCARHQAMGESLQAFYQDVTGLASVGMAHSRLHRSCCSHVSHENATAHRPKREVAGPPAPSWPDLQQVMLCHNDHASVMGIQTVSSACRQPGHLLQHQSLVPQLRWSISALPVTPLANRQVF